MGKFKEVFEDGYPALKSIDYPHHEIHEGKMFSRDFYCTTINDPSGVKFGIKPTGTDYTAHIIWGAHVSAGARLELYEGVTFTHTGAKMYGWNNNRNVSGSSNTIIFSGVSMSGALPFKATGNLISTQYYGAAGGGVNNAAGGGSRDQEFILKQNTNYMFWLRPGADGLTAKLSLEWYEHT